MWPPPAARRLEYGIDPYYGYPICTRGATEGMAHVLLGNGDGSFQGARDLLIGEANQVPASAAYDAPVTVNFATADGTAQASSGDYTAAAGTLTFAPGETTKTITVMVKGDKTAEGDETFSVRLRGRFKTEHANPKRKRGLSSLTLRVGIETASKQRIVKRLDRR